MGMIFTKYEDTANNNIKFDVSKFDFAYDDDTFPAETATDFDNIILENGAAFNITREETIQDGMGTISDISESSFLVYGYLMDISKKEFMIQEMGLAVPGNRVIYLKPNYTTTSGGVDTSNVVKEDDILVDRNGYRWRLVKIIHEPYLGGTQIYKKCVVKSIGLEGSP